MTTIAEPATFRWTREDYYRAAETGLFGDRRVQLIEGEVIEMAPQRDEHAFCVRLAAVAAGSAFGKRYTVSTQLPMRLADGSEPEPDIAVIAGSVRENPTHPTTALLVVEVADTTLTFDRRRKRPLYAKASVQEYWIVNLIDGCVEVHRNPVQDPDGSWRYIDVHIARRGESISPVAMPQASIAVVDLLP